MNLLPCPFCDGEPEVRLDAPEPRPFLIRCMKSTCPGHTSTSYAEDDVATSHWQCRAQMPPPNLEPVHSLAAFTTRSLMRGEMLWLDLDRTGVLTSDALRFRPVRVRMTKVPALVQGSCTRWRIALEHYGKNACRTALVATCLTNGKSLTLVDGREGVTEGAAQNGFLVQIGTVKCRLMAAAVAQGVAEFVDIRAATD